MVRALEVAEAEAMSRHQLQELQRDLNERPALPAEDHSGRVDELGLMARLQEKISRHHRCFIDFG